MALKVKNGEGFMRYMETSGGGTTDGDPYITHHVLTSTGGNPIDSHVSADGGYHLGVAIEQSVFADVGNSSTTNLTNANAHKFTGASRSTLGVVGLQWALKTDKNATVCIEQSDDESNWDLSDCWDYFYSKGGTGGTAQALKSYWRITVTLTGTEDTGYFRLSGVLCPIADPVPRKLSNSGNLQVVTSLRGNENYSRHVWVNPTNELAVSPVYRIVGTAFIEANKDVNFWSETIANNGTVVQAAGVVQLETNVTASGAAKYTSADRNDVYIKGRFVGGSAMLFVGAANFVTSGTVGNLRAIGPYETDNGFFFRLDGTTFSIGSRTNITGSPVDSLITSGNFNGNLGSDFTPAAATYYKLSIEYTPLSVDFYINGKLLHTKVGAGQSATMDLPITIENTNTTIDTDIAFHTVGMYIARQGELTTERSSFYQEGTGTVNLKVGAGKLYGGMLGGVVANSVITIYDSLTATGKVIWESGSMEKKTNPFPIEFFGLPFSIGLTLAITIQNSNLNLVYE